jgi:hypothetical protein
MTEPDWAWMTAVIVFWILLIAAFGYAAALISWRDPYKRA